MYSLHSKPFFIIEEKSPILTSFILLTSFSFYDLPNALFWQPIKVMRQLQKTH